MKIQSALDSPDHIAAQVIEYHKCLLALLIHLRQAQSLYLQPGKKSCLPHLRKVMNEYYWIKVTKDKYELPIAVADSAHELARMLKVSPSCVCHAVKRKNSQYKKVKKLKR